MINLPSALAIGWAPVPKRSMIDRRRWPKATQPFDLLKRIGNWQARKPALTEGPLSMQACALTLRDPLLRARTVNSNLESILRGSVTWNPPTLPGQDYFSLARLDRRVILSSSPAPRRERSAIVNTPDPLIGLDTALSSSYLHCGRGGFQDS
jgi:hypothetical protein